MISELELLIIHKFPFIEHYIYNYTLYSLDCCMVYNNKIEKKSMCSNQSEGVQIYIQYKYDD